jgi:hypothetical protein
MAPEFSNFGDAQDKTGGVNRRSAQSTLVAVNQPCGHVV